MPEKPEPPKTDWADTLARGGKSHLNILGLNLKGNDGVSLYREVCRRFKIERDQVKSIKVGDGVAKVLMKDGTLKEYTL